MPISGHARPKGVNHDLLDGPASARERGFAPPAMTTMGVFHHIPPWSVLALICAVLLLITLIPLGRFRKHQGVVKKSSRAGMVFQSSERT